MYRKYHITKSRAHPDIKVNSTELKQTSWLIKRLILVQIPQAFVFLLIL